MRAYTLIATMWIIIILYSKENFAIACACAAVHILCLIGYEIQQLTKKLVEQRKDDATSLHRTLSAIGLDITHAVNELKNK